MLYKRRRILINIEALPGRKFKLLRPTKCLRTVYSHYELTLLVLIYYLDRHDSYELTRITLILLINLVNPLFKYEFYDVLILTFPKNVQMLNYLYT